VHGTTGKSWADFYRRASMPIAKFADEPAGLMAVNHGARPRLPAAGPAVRPVTVVFGDEPGPLL